MRWLLIFLFAALVFNGMRGWLHKVGLGKLPGDFTLRWRGREWYLPLGSSLLLSLLAMVVGALL